MKISSPHVTSCKNMSLVSCCLNWGQHGLREPQLEHIGPVFFPVIFCTIILGKSTTLGQRNYNINTHYLSFPLRSFPCSRDSHTVKVDSATPVYCTRRPGLFSLPSPELDCSHYTSLGSRLSLIKSLCSICSLSLTLISAPAVFLTADVGRVHSSAISRQPFSNAGF